MKFHLIFLFVLTIFLSAFAGGDCRSMIVKNITKTNGIYRIHLEEEKTKYPIVPECTEFYVELKYARVPWYSWIPFMGSSHPSKAKTIDAISALTEAMESGEKVCFGYMGSGLIKSEEDCVYKSKGLEIIQEEPMLMILSYHNPV